MSTANWPTYARPATRLEAPPSHPRPLTKLQAPPLTQLDARLRINEASVTATATPTPFTRLFSRTTHIVPAAFPRMYTGNLTEADYLQPPANLHSEPSSDRKLRARRAAKMVLEKRRTFESGAVPPNPEASPVLLMEVERFARVEDPSSDPRLRKQGLTLVFAHANGFHKEMWDIVIRQIEAHPEAPRIQEIWAYDAANQGGSASLNRGLLGDAFDWLDNARDFLNLVAAYIPSSATSAETPLPVVLPRIPEWEVQRRMRNGFSDRTVVGIGHSMGACALARAAEECGALWSSLILLDQAFVPGLNPDPTGGVEGLVTGALSRRSTWNSRAEALKLFQSNPFFAAFDPEILNIYVEHGLTDDIETGGVKLKTSGFQEAVTFSERRSTYETWELLDTIDVHIPIHWILSGLKPIVTGNEEVTAQTAWRRWKNSSNIRVPGAGHLVTQEAPKATADAICAFLTQTYNHPEPTAFHHALTRANL